MYTETDSGFQEHCYLYMNDDFLVAKKLKSGDFFDDRGRVSAFAYVHVALPLGLGFIDLPYGLGKLGKKVCFALDWCEASVRLE